MSDIETVVLCRDRMEALRSLGQDLDILRKRQTLLPEANEELQQVIDKTEAALNASRQELPDLVVKALGVLQRLPYRERRVLMLYYVTGASLKEISEDMHYALRSVQKIKKAGLDKLR